MTPRLLLALECAALYVGVPLLLRFRVLPNLPVPILIVTSLAAWLWLRRQPGFDRESLLRLDPRRIPALVFSSAAISLLIVACVAWFAPRDLFSLARRSPVLWAAVMVLYPVFSVYPQELLYRAFLFHRYRALFANEPARVLASAALFAFVHIIFGNWLSVVLTFLGGLLFAGTYARTGSLPAASIQHAILGDAIFTAGIGRFFYHGAAFR